MAHVTSDGARALAFFCCGFFPAFIQPLLELGLGLAQGAGKLRDLGTTEEEDDYQEDYHAFLRTDKHTFTFKRKRR